MVAGAALVFQSRNHEPTYHDRSLGDWLVGLTNYNGDDDTDQAAEAVRNIGTNAIPYLVQYTRYTPWPLRLKSTEVIAALTPHLYPRKVPLDKLYNSGILDECLMPYACVDAGSVKPCWGESLPELWGRTHLHDRMRSRSFVCAPTGVIAKASFV